MFSISVLAKNTNGMANGPKTAPIIAQNITFDPLFSAIVPKRKAKAKLIRLPIIIPTIPKYPS